MNRALTATNALVALATMLIAVVAVADGGQEITVGEGETQVMRIAQGAPNRIVTPYESAKFVTNVQHEAWAVNGVLYVLPMESEHTMAGFIQDESGEWAIPVVFEVAKIPPQEIRLNDPRYEPTAKGEKPEDLAIGETGSHVDKIVDLLVTALNSEQVPGFQQSNERGREVYVGPLHMTLEHTQRRGGLVIERHHIVHEGMEPRQLNEASFEVPGRVGVLVFPPMTEIAPGQEARVFIARRAGNE